MVEPGRCQHRVSVQSGRISRCAATVPAGTLRPRTDYDFADLEALAAWLDDPASPDGALSLPALEGYLAAIATQAPNLA